jgi:hypothetical protein
MIIELVSIYVICHLACARIDVVKDQNDSVALIPVTHEPNPVILRQVTTEISSSFASMRWAFFPLKTRRAIGVVLKPLSQELPAFVFLRGGGERFSH